MTRTLRNILLLVFCILCVTSNSIGQSSKHTLAEQRMKTFEFKSAASIYDDILKKHPFDVVALRNAAICNKEIGHIQKSEACLRLLVDSTNAASEADHVLYADMLKMNQKYDEANEVYKTMQMKFPENSVSEAYLARSNWAHVLLRDSSLFNVKVSKVSSKYSDFGPNFLADSLIVFSSSRGEGKGGKRVYDRNNQSFLNLYVAETLMDSTLTNARVLENNLNSRFHEGMITLDTVNNEIYITRNNFNKGIKSNSTDGMLNLALFSAKFEDGEWGDLTPFPYNNADYSVGHPSISDDGQRLFFASNMPGGFGGSDIYLCERDTLGSWGTPKNMGPVINTFGNESFPFIHPENRLYFSSDGHIGLGGLDIYFANLDFSMNRVSNIGYPVCTSHDDFGLIMYENGKRGHFSSNRPGGMGDDDIYEYLNILPSEMNISGFVTEAESGNPVNNAMIRLKSSKHSETWKEVALTDSSGFYAFTEDYELEYVLVASAPGYFPSEIVLDAPGMSAFMEGVNFELQKIDFYAKGDVIYADTEKPAQDATVSLFAENGKEIAQLVTKADGNYEFGLLAGTIYTLKCSKQGYPDQAVTLNTINRSDSVFFNVFRLFELRKGVTVEMDNIYYDYNKWEIREDAKEQLDRLVLLLKDNPTVIIELSSHTDSRGSDSYNLELSKKRANAAVEYMQTQGIAKNRLVSKGYGEKKLKNKCKNGVQCSDDQHQQNRRTEFTILDL